MEKVFKDGGEEDVMLWLIERHTKVMGYDNVLRLHPPQNALEKRNFEDTRQSEHDEENPGTCGYENVEPTKR